MKITKFFPLVIFLLLAISLQAQKNRIAMVDFMRIPEGGSADYVKMEKEVWKPMHQEWANQGKLVGWYLWQIPYPGGSDAEYHYATVRIYDDLADIENPMEDMEAVFKKVHPGKDMDKISKHTLASRDLTKTYALSSWERFFAEDVNKPSEVIQVVYFKVGMDKWDAYQAMERNYYHPTHKAEIKAGTRSGWEGWILRRPMGDSMPFQFVAVDHFKDWAQYTKSNPKDLYDNVFKGNEMELRDDIFHETVSLVKLEEWRLVDYVQAPMVTAITTGK